MFHPLVLSPLHTKTPPLKFTCPFCYRPHPWVEAAAQQVQAYLSRQTAWQRELEQGKMFGVLVVRTPKNEIGFLAAFSGLLGQSFHHSYFVPPVYDYLKADGEFVQGTQHLASMGIEIDRLRQSPDYLTALRKLEETRMACQRELEERKAELSAHKALRDAERAAGLGDEAQRIRKSQFEKAELKRFKEGLLRQLSAAQARVDDFESQIKEMEDARRRCSEDLQHWLFDQYRVCNARGESITLNALFAKCRHAAAPAGAGDCAAPKLLQYAYLHHYTPLAMGEFWWGQSPLGEPRRHGHYYPACQSKCGPILEYMLQGLEVEDNPLVHRQAPDIRILFEDQWMVVVDKPAGRLSVAGKLEHPSVEQTLQQRYGDQLKAVHRLDMDTSGILIFAKDAAAHSKLQQLFAGRQVAKTYLAMVERCPNANEGDIRLPLRPNPNDRPRQMVDPVHGKTALTHYRVLRENGDGLCLLELQPHTGRTHQLRVHCAHHQGLDCPIVGDKLYGRHGERLMLHCHRIELTHPYTGLQLRLESPCPF